MAREIPLTQGFVAIVDDDDFDVLSQWRWRYKRRGDGHQGYAVRTTRYAGSRAQTTVYMHRFVFGGEAPVVDHVSGDKLDNRRANLRAATHQQNMWNSSARRSATSRFKGVRKEREKWIASIWCSNRSRRLGSFACEIEAAKTYDCYAKELFGEFARLNFPVAA